MLADIEPLTGHHGLTGAFNLRAAQLCRLKRLSGLRFPRSSFRCQHRWFP